MTKEEIEKLYREKIIPESKSAYHFEERIDAELEILANNPICGDKYKVYLYFEDDQVKEVYFHGFGCAISKASTSFLARNLEGMKRAKVKPYIQAFLQALEKREADGLQDENLEFLVELMNFDGRQDCIELSWKALENNSYES